MLVHLLSTPVPTMDNRHTNIHVQFMHTYYAKRYKHIDSHSDRQSDKVLHKPETLHYRDCQLTWLSPCSISAETGVLV